MDFPTIALTGDSQLTETSSRFVVTKLPPRLRAIGFDVVTVAVGGSTSRDLLDQRVPGTADWIVVSVGTNDAAPWKQVPSDEFEANCGRFLRDVGVVNRVVLGPGPIVEQGVDGERTDAATLRYAAALERAATATGAIFLPLPSVIDPSDLADDGVHLSDSAYEKLVAALLAIIRSTDAGTT